MYIILPLLNQTMFLKVGKKQSTGIPNIEFWIFHWHVVGIYLLLKADDCHKSNMKQLYFSKQ